MVVMLLHSVAWPKTPSLGQTMGQRPGLSSTYIDCPGRAGVTQAKGSAGSAQCSAVLH